MWKCSNVYVIEVAISQEWLVVSATASSASSLSGPQAAPMADHRWASAGEGGPFTVRRRCLFWGNQSANKPCCCSGAPDDQCRRRCWVWSHFDIIARIYPGKHGTFDQ